MNWNRSRLDYYWDFGFIPFVIAIVVAVFSVSWLVVGAGFVLWTLAEYWIHRLLFHVTFKRQHWQHHRKPAGFVAAPTWQTSIVHALTFAALVALPMGASLFVGLELGYLAYIVMHDRIHHARGIHKGWLFRRWWLHNIHHKGAEKNFGVFTSVWDHVFGTYLERAAHVR